jgi:DNA-binding GntR family transcriptional regulator
MDGLSSYLAAQRISEDGKEKLNEVTENFNNAVETGNMDDMIKYDSLFHKIIVEETHNSYLINMMEKLQELVLRFRYIYYKDFRRAEDMPKEHKIINESINNGDMETARKESELHIRKLKELIIEEADNFV